MACSTSEESDLRFPIPVSMTVFVIPALTVVGQTVQRSAKQLSWIHQVVWVKSGLNRSHGVDG